MNYRSEADDELERSTNRVMAVGVGLMVAMAAIFPLYRWFEPANRDEARAANVASLAQQGEELFALSCTSCHGTGGEGGIGPALNSKQFLQSATDAQIELLVAVGVPGSAMNAYSLDFGGPLTSEQIRAITVFLRSWEDTAPDVPDWRTPVAG